MLTCLVATMLGNVYTALGDMTIIMPLWANIPLSKNEMNKEIKENGLSKEGNTASTHKEEITQVW